MYETKITWKVPGLMHFLLPWDGMSMLMLYSVLQDESEITDEPGKVARATLAQL